MKDTKEQIMREALRLFARDGYEAVSVSDIAGVLGITKGALYRHYGSKRDIFEHILRRMENDDFAGAEEHSLPTAELCEENEAEYRKVSPESLAEFAKTQFVYWTEDEFAADFRRMLTLEQYRDPEMSGLFGQYLGAGPLSYVEEILRSLGYPSPEMSAVRFYAPMFLFYSLHDHAAEEERPRVRATAFECIDRITDELKKEKTI